MNQDHPRVKNKGIAPYASFRRFRLLLQIRLMAGYLVGAFWARGESCGYLPTSLSAGMVSSSCASGLMQQIGICLTQCIFFPVLYLAGLRQSGFFHTSGVWNLLFCFLHGLSFPVAGALLVSPETGWIDRWLLLIFFTATLILHYLYSKSYLSAMRGICWKKQILFEKNNREDASPMNRSLPVPLTLLPYFRQMLTRWGAALLLQFLSNILLSTVVQ